MKIKKLGALLVSAALCAGMAAPAFAFEGEAAPAFGREICTARAPKCSECFLQDICKSKDKR